MLPHAFVIARILPAQSSSQTSLYGSEVAGKFRTRPFLALRIHLHPETGFYAASPSPLSPKGLFVVSPYKPAAPFEDFYLPLTPGDRKKALKLNRPLPDHGHPLYIHTYPLLREYCNLFDSRTKTPIEPSFYQLDDESYRQLITLYRDLLPPSTQLRLSGSEHAQPGWGTYSGQHRYERQEPDSSFVFEFSPFTGAFLRGAADIWIECATLTMLQKEYSWMGVTRTIDWLYDLRSWSGCIQPYLGCARRPNSGDVPLIFEESFKALVLPPAAGMEPEPMRAQLGDATGDSDDSDSSDDGWFPARPKFATVVLRPTMMTGPSKSGIRAVVFDLCGAIVDFTCCPREALLQLGIPEAGIDQWVVYLRELQALEGSSSNSTLIDVARRVLHTVASSLPLITQAQFEAAVRSLVTPRLIPGIKDTLTALHKDGYAIFGYSSLDVATYEVLARPLVSALQLCVLPAFDKAPGLFSPCTQDHMRLVRENVRDQFLPGLLPEQVVVVSPSSVRALEPAAADGMVTALLVVPGHPEVDALKEQTSVESTMVVDPDDLAALMRTPANWKKSEPWKSRGLAERVCGVYELLETLQESPYGATVSEGISWLANEHVAVKYELLRGDHIAPSAVEYEARVYAHLADCSAIPRVHWFGSDGGADVLVMDLLGPTLENLRLACRGALSLKSVLMIGIQMLDFIEFVHSRGLILRDIKPQNSAVGRAPHLAGTIYHFDFGNVKAYIDPRTGSHVPLRTGCKITGTLRFCSHWTHQGLECGRRDDIAVLGHTLLHLLHGNLPWQGIYASSREAKLQRVGEMKNPDHPALRALLADTPAALSGLMSHAYTLEFAQQPDYIALRGLLNNEMAVRGWTNDGLFDWVHPELTAPLGTLLPSEYESAFIQGSVPPSIVPLFNSSGESNG